MKHLQDTSQASSSIYRAIIRISKSLYSPCALSLFSRNTNLFFLIFLLPFLFSSFFLLVVHFPYCAWRRASPDCISIPAFARGKITINYFPKFYPPCGDPSLARHFLAPFSAIKSRFEVRRGCACVCVCVFSRFSAFEFCRKKGNASEMEL